MLKQIYRLFGMVLGVLAAIVFVVYAIKTLTVHDLSQYFTAHALTGIFAAAALYTAVIPISAWAWKRMLTDIGCTHSSAELSMIMGITQIAKYLPGNIGQHIGRAAMSMARNIAIRPFLLTVFSETLLTLLAGLMIGTIGAFFSQMGLVNFTFGKQAILIPILAALLFLVIFLYPPLAPRLLKHFFPNASFSNILPRPPTLLQALAAYSLNYIIIGVGILVIATTLLPDMKHDYMLLVASFALAWFAGFLTPGAPAGLGIREVIMLGILSHSYPGSSGLLIVVGFRLTTILGDTLCFLVAYSMLFFSRRATTST
ncbi:lysylphosphatidylglycerol synthase domain-containing protein [Collimonas fungivorans]|uniref:lysylphosphatidylglycerol synthase domain-containing protein n=1 Tax=Collimonas fungivorans TaxID=158899 RepID=UPI000778489F|nr:lysylphosphatidylglycerol synthase domain-containing protein [Collimonas fungivorans]